MNETAPQPTQTPPPAPPPTAEPLASPQAAPPPPAPVPVANDPRRRSVFLATVLSAVMPGAGQVYCGYYQQGFINAIVFASIIAGLAFEAVEALIPLGAIFLAFFWLYSLIDAGRRAMFYNEALAGRSGIELPSDLQTPGLRGSVPAGVLIAAVGVLLLAHTQFGMPLDWLEQWWPAALIGFGGFLVYKAKKDAAERPEDE